MKSIEPTTPQKTEQKPERLTKTKKAGLASFAAVALLAACSSDKAPVSAEIFEVVTTVEKPEATVPSTSIPQKGGPTETLPPKAGPGEVVSESEALKNYTEYLRSAERTELIRDEIEQATQQLVDNALQAENIGLYSSGDLMNEPVDRTVADHEGFLRVEGTNQAGVEVQFTIFGNYTYDGTGVGLPGKEFFDPVTFMGNTTLAGTVYEEDRYQYDREVVALGNSIDPESYITGYMLPEGDVINEDRIVFHRASETGVSGAGKGGESIPSPDQLRDFDAEVFAQMQDIVQRVN